jgi:pimeloyl-ACP methyl ester carboxylesterase
MFVVDVMNTVTGLFSYGDVSLEYQVIEGENSYDSARHAIVMLHEGLGSVALWKDFPTQLARATSRRVIVYSREGYGDSTPIKKPRSVDYMHREARDVLPCFLEHVDVKSPILFGHSDGASIALIHAGSGFDVSALILMAPHVFVEELTLESIRQAKVAFESSDLPKKLSRYHGDVESAFRGWNDIWLNDDFRTWNIESYVEHIKSPCLLVQSKQDPYGTLRQLTSIESVIPQLAKTLILEDCGHSPHVDQTERTLEGVLNFLEDGEIG